MANRNRLLPESVFMILIAAYGLLNFLQAYLTPINSDEAYYWMYSRYPAWGYFDHPPAIAMMIKAGYAIIKNEAGVILFVIIFQLISVYLLWQLTDPAKKSTPSNVIFFFLLIFASPVLNIFGFYATPDSPLLFFEALFLFMYKRFREKNDWISALCLGVIMAAIMYSKYHGAILIIAVIVSDIQILKNPKAYA